MCHIQIAPFAHEKIRYMDMYVHRNFMTTAKHVVLVEAIKCLGKYMTICLILSCEKKQSICDKTAFLYFTLNRFREKNR